MKIVEMRSNNVKLSDAITEANCLLDNIEQAGADSSLHINILPNFIGRLDKQISKGESLVGAGQSMIATTHPGDPVTDQLAFDFSTWNQPGRAVIIKPTGSVGGLSINTYIARDTA